jgi:phosphoglycolate phosphatase
MVGQQKIEMAPKDELIHSSSRADAFIFDIDGTLLVTRDLVHWNALHQAMFEAYGIDATIEGIQYHGNTDRGILRAACMRAGVSEVEFEAKLPLTLQVLCREVEQNKHSIQALPCNAVPQVLERLMVKGKLLGIASGNLSAVGWIKLESCHLAAYFQFGCFSDLCERRCDIFANAVEEVRKHAGVKVRICFVGDTPADIAAARQVGAEIIAVASGTFSRQDLEAHAPDVCIGSCEDFFLAPRLSSQ